MVNRKLSESIAKLEESIIEFERIGNKRAANCAKMVLKRLKKEKPNTMSGFTQTSVRKKITS